LRVTTSVWGTAVADDPVATTVTWTLAGDAACAWKLAPPQPDRPAAQARVHSSNRQICQEGPIFAGFRLRAKTAIPVRLPGHQNASARRAVGRVAPDGVCLKVLCALIVTGENYLVLREHTVHIGREVGVT